VQSIMENPHCLQINWQRFCCPILFWDLMCGASVDAFTLAVYTRYLMVAEAVIGDLVDNPEADRTTY